MHSKLIIAVAIVAASNSATNAGVAPSAPFATTAIETFDDPTTTRSTPMSIFADTADVSAESGILIRAQSWQFSSKGRTDPHSGRYFIGSTTGAAVYNFDTPIYAFAGFFSTNTAIPGATAEFFSPTGDLLATLDMTVPAAPTDSTDWAFNAFASTDPISSVRIAGNYGSGGFVMMDDIQISTTPVPTPGTLATIALAGLSASRRRRTN